MPINYKDYCKDWKLRSKFIRFYRAKNKCEFCGSENYKPHPETGSKVVLTVAHLDHDIKNNSFFNLKALCQKCHNNYDKDYRKQNRSKKRNQYQHQINFNPPCLPIWQASFSKP
jgi:hypothetical protein